MTGVQTCALPICFDVEFISFDDIKNNGIPKDMDVIINAGDAGTAFSGGEKWLDKEIITTIREWIYNGGGFVGVGEPSAVLEGGHFFQLSEALGVDKELGFSLSTDKYFNKELDKHFITADVTGEIDFGEGQKNVYAKGKDTEIICYRNGDLLMSSNDYGKGRAVYIAGLPYSIENTRILMRSCFYAAHKEDKMKIWYADNLNCEVSAYLESNKYAVINNSHEKQITFVYDGNGNKTEVELQPGEIKWNKIS